MEGREKKDKWEKRKAGQKGTNGGGRRP